MYSSSCVRLIHFQSKELWSDYVDWWWAGCKWEDDLYRSYIISMSFLTFASKEIAYRSLRMSCLVRLRGCVSAWCLPSNPVIKCWVVFLADESDESHWVMEFHRGYSHCAFALLSWLNHMSISWWVNCSN